MATILGISTSHDGTLSVLKDGKHVFSIAEERLSRIKGHIGFPFQALDYVIENGIVDPTDVTTIAIAQSLFHAGRNASLEFEYTRDKIYYDLQNDEPPQGYIIENKLFSGCISGSAVAARLKEVVAGFAASHGINAQVELLDHHTCHAAATFFASEESDPLMVTLDGEGDGVSGSVSVIDNGEIKRLAVIDQRDSLGNIYSAITRQLGYKISRHEGKITGLAAYGSADTGTETLNACIAFEDGLPTYRRKLSDLARAKMSGLTPGGKKMVYTRKPKAIAAMLADLDAKDQAASVQVFLEQQACKFVEFWLKKTGKTSLHLNGGVFANVKLNQRIGDLAQVQSLFIYPNMGDGGNAVGAAYLAAERQQKGAVSLVRQTDMYLGPDYAAAAIQDVLVGRDDLTVSQPKGLTDIIAADIHAGKIIGWFQGRMEFGPRALGHRSILARPTERKLNDELNRRLSRTEFMPFAPSCLIEAADEVFDIKKDCLKYPAEFMTITFDVRPEWVSRIQAVSHVDDTARPQLVRRETNPEYHALISAYRDLSGIPMVVNTSFNNHEEPIVCQPSEALAALDAGVIDILVMDSFVVQRKSDAN
jgi:carbamoyltransferase